MANILVVDDKPTNREYLTTLLAYRGHSTLEAGDGAEALAIAKDSRPDLIIADILMPTMDGYELVRQLRAEASVASTPVIFCTAHFHEREARRLAQACGVSSVITKPAEPQAVLTAVENALGAARPHSPPDAKVSGGADSFDREHLRVLTDKLSKHADDLTASNERLSAMVDLSTQLASELDPWRLVQSFVHAVRQIIGARSAVAGVLDSQGVRFQFLPTSGMSENAAATIRALDPEAPAIKTILSQGKSLRLREGDASAAAFSASHPPFQAWLGAPIASLNRIYGFVALIDKVGSSEFTEEDERLTRALAAQVGRIYHNGSLYAEAKAYAAGLEREIVARTETERRLAEREEHIRLLLDSTAEAIYGIDREGRCTFANAACARILGYRGAGEFIGRDMHPLMHHTRRDGAPYSSEDCRIWGCLRHNQPVHSDDELFWRADGSSFPAECSAYPVLRNGVPVGAVITFLDITERRKLEREYRRAQQRLREVVVSSPAVLYTLGVEEERLTTLTWVSGNLPSVLGYSPEAALAGEWWWENVHPDDRERVAEDTHRQLFGRGQSAAEFRFRHAGGDYRWIRSELRLIRDDAGRAVEAVGAWSDISERKKAELEQLKLREQFLQAQKLESIGRLAGGVAHDFNNLLTVINGYSDLLIKELEPTEHLRDMAGEIGLAGQRAAELTRQLLLLSRKQVAQTTEVDVNDVVREVSKMLKRVIGEDIRLEMHLNDELGRVLADSWQMHQVLMNLAVNARDAMPQGGRLIIETSNIELDESYAGMHAHVKPGSYIELRVSDTGVGMTPEVLSHIFEPFFTTKKVGEGTGLGLATIYGIVQQTGGSISVYSEPGKGASFRIYLPRTEPGGPAVVVEKRDAASLRGTETILVVEDQEQLLKMAATVLKGYGYKVLQAASPEAALAESNGYEGEIHLLLTDVVMPQMSGVDLAVRLAAVRPGLRAMYMSGYSERMVADVRELGSYLMKPFSPEALGIKVREALDLRSADGPRTAAT